MGAETTSTGLSGGGNPIRTRYEGPTVVREFRLGGRSVHLVLPQDPDGLLNEADVLELNRNDDYMPYWAYLWPGAYLLAEAVGREPWLEGTAALEIGCGLGLAGMVGIAAGLRVTFTDYDETPLRFVEASIQKNGHDEGVATTRRMDWRRPNLVAFPVILGADVLYEKRLVPLVADVIRTLLAPEGVALVAGPYRVATLDLDEVLTDRGLRATAESISALTGEGTPVRGTLHRIQHRT